MATRVEFGAIRGARLGQGVALVVRTSRPATV
jgi:hypothetical protein